MSWVLWDIFIPLLTTFALGLLLGWMLWKWQRRLMGADELIISGAGVENSVASVEMESANIALIGERDTVAQQLEQANNDIAQLRASNAELEKSQTDTPDQASSDGTTNGLADSTTNTTGILGAVAGEPVAKDSEDLLQMQQNLDALTESLDREKESRRQLELELLNAKNRCEKLEQQLDVEPDAEENPSELKLMDGNEDKNTGVTGLRTSVQPTQGISLQQHQNEISERDAKIEDLKCQLKAQVEDLGESEVQGDATAQDKPANCSDNKKTASEEQSEVNGKKTKAKRSGKKSLTKKTASGYVPTAWVIPAQTPTKGERDKLTEIKGVGPVLEGLLHDSGIYYFRQVALLDKAGVDELQEQIPQFPGRIRRDKWVKQSRQLHRTKYGSAP